MLVNQHSSIRSRPLELRGRRIRLARLSPSTGINGLTKCSSLIFRGILLHLSCSLLLLLYVSLPLISTFYVSLVVSLVFHLLLISNFNLMLIIRYGFSYSSVEQKQAWVDLV